MLYLKKQKQLEITKNTSDLLVIEKPKNLNNLYLKLAFFLAIGAASLYYAIVYNQSIQSMSSFLLMASAVPIVYAFISVAGLITEIIGYKIVFDKQTGELTLNSKICCDIRNIRRVILAKREKTDNFKEWIKYKLLVQTIDERTIVLAISKKTEVLLKLANAISTFLEIQLVLSSTGKENEKHIISKEY